MKVKEARRAVAAAAIDSGTSCKAEDGGGGGTGLVGGVGRITLIIPNITLRGEAGRL